MGRTKHAVWAERNMLSYMNEKIDQVDELIRVEDETDPYLYPQIVVYYSDHIIGEKGKNLISHNQKYYDFFDCNLDVDEIPIQLSTM